MLLLLLPLLLQRHYHYVVFLPQKKLVHNYIYVHVIAQLLVQIGSLFLPQYKKEQMHVTLYVMQLLGMYGRGENLSCSM